MKLRLQSFKIIYNLSKGRTKAKKVNTCYGERMSEEEYEKTMRLVNECKLLNK